MLADECPADIRHRGIQHQQVLFQGIADRGHGAALGLVQIADAAGGAVHHVAVAYHHAAVEVMPGQHPHLIGLVQQAFLPALLGRGPAPGLGLTGDDHDQLYIRVNGLQPQHGFRCQQIEPQRAAIQEAAVTGLIQRLQQGRQQPGQVGGGGIGQLPVTGEADGAFPQGGILRPVGQESIFSTARKASLGTCTVPNWRIRFLPSFCFSSSFFFRVMSPP